MERLYSVIRSPVLMEDEGHPQLIKVFRTQKEAESWIRNQKGRYFGPEDYYVSYPVEPS